MSKLRIASRYAKSLLDLAKENGKLDRIKDDLSLFSQAVENRDLFLMIKSPIIKGNKKSSVFKAIFDGKIDTLTSAFFDIVIRKGREDLLPEIATSFVDQYNDLHGITTAHLTTATEIDDTLMATIKSKLSLLGASSDKVNLIKKIDPSIIGGFILQVGDKLIDASVKTKLAKLKKELVDA